MSYNLLPLGSMIFVLFCVKKNGWGWTSFIKEVNTGEGKKISDSKLLQFYMTYILPIIIMVVYLKGYYDTFQKYGNTVLIGWMTFAIVLLVAIMAVVLRKPFGKNK